MAEVILVFGFRRLRFRIAYASILAGVLAASLVGGSSSSATRVDAAPLAAPSPQLVSGITVLNLSNSSVTAEIHFFNPNGSEVSSAALTNIALSPLQQRTWYSPNIPNLPAGFAGSAVVSATGPVSAILNVQSPTTTGTSPSDPTRVGTAAGILDSQVASSLFLPQIMRNYGGWHSAISVQNAGASSESVKVSYRDSSGHVVNTETASIPANASHTFDQSTNSALGTFLGSAVVQAVDSGGNPDSSGQLAAIFNLFNAYNDNTTAQLLTYNASDQGATTLYAPRVLNNYYGFNSGITIQNLDSSNTANVQVTFQFAGNSPKQLSVSVPPQSSVPLYVPNLSVGGQPLPSGNANGKGSATLVSTGGQAIIAVVNEDCRVVGSSFVGEATSYNAFLEGTQTQTAFMPQVTSRYYGFASGVTVQNAGSQTGSGTITLTNSNGQSQSFPTGNIAPGASTIYFVPNLWTANDFNGSAKVTFSQPIFVIENMSFRGDVDPRYASPGSPEQYGDSLTGYAALNQ